MRLHKRIFLILLIATMTFLFSACRHDVTGVYENHFSSHLILTLNEDYTYVYQDYIFSDEMSTSRGTYTYNPQTNEIVLKNASPYASKQYMYATYKPGSSPSITLENYTLRKTK